MNLSMIFFKPWYKSAEGDESEQIEGEDPILEAEKIIWHSGRGNIIRLDI